MSLSHKLTAVFKFTQLYYYMLVLLLVQRQNQEDALSKQTTEYHQHWGDKKNNVC